jgi:5-methylcytosine-specific restriction endonuclease McrA
MSSSQHPQHDPTQTTKEQQMIDLPSDKFVFNLDSSFGGTLPNEQQKKKRKPIFNDELGYRNSSNVLGKIDPSCEVLYKENDYERRNRNFVEETDFVYVAVVFLNDYQEQFLSVFENTLDRYKNGNCLFPKGRERTHDYYLFGKTIEEIVIAINMTIEIHTKKDLCFKDWPQPLKSLKTIVSRQSRVINPWKKFGVIIYPNSRCVGCLSPVNPLLEKCELEENKSGTKTFIRCRYCINKANYEKQKMEADSKKTSAYLARREAYKNGDRGITWKVIGEKENWLCHLCGDLVDSTVSSNKSNGPTIDHLTPITKGGKHEWDNVKLAHRSCNSSKSNRPIKPKATA